eukprot:RCo036648
MLYGNKVANYYATYVDVRDVAVAHVEALVRPEAGGQRFIVGHTSMWALELGKPLQELFPDLKIEPRTYSPYKVWLAWALSFVGPSLLTPFAARILSKKILFDNSKSRQVLQLQYTDLRVSLTDTLRSMVDSGWVKARPRTQAAL